MAKNAPNNTTPPSLRLYGCWRSTSTHRVILALHFYGLTFEYSPVDLTAREQETPAFRAISPDAQVPVLIADGTTLTQSFGMILYLDALYGDGLPPLIPLSPTERALAIGYCERVSSFVQPLTLPGAVRRALKAHLGAQDDAFDDRLAGFISATLGDNLQLLDRAIARHGGPFVLGEAPTIADLFVYPQLLGAARLKIDLEAFPNLSAQARAMAGLDFVKAADPLALPDAPAAA